ncbi:SixA phosphatase family protein [Bifidobacterium biavatii]|uniref:Phosphohistidine phosphatase n=1 Tax=Bifidobacterium biavatii DSM 23969 TaxID=1437608 RepID=A0A087A0K9_9BIFI|nr:histidine phosphatase family protein [Bifidobacterium biavatii]KFI52309.1 phosphohistidine phosphatase [Bifidobacterium biavatii DSM 23969]
MAVKPGKAAKKAKVYQHILIIMRHAKAEPFGVNGDRDRPLADKGLKQAKAVAKGLLDMKLVPDRIACSAALRTQQTCEKMLKTFGDGPKVDYRQSLYDGGMQAVLDELAHTKDKHRVLMVLGHEPTVSIASQWLASAESDPATIDLLNLGMSTASVAIFGSDKPFSQWQLHEADLLAVISPKDFD